MKRILSLFLFLSLTLSIPLPATSASKVYLDCDALRIDFKAGVAATGYKNRGSDVFTPKINTAVYLANKKLDSDRDKIVCEISKASSLGTAEAALKGPAVPISLDNLDPVWTARVALQSVQKLQQSNQTLSGIAEIIPSPTVQKNEIELEKRLVDEAVTTFQKYFLPNKFQIVMFTNRDSAWADEALIRYGGSFPGQVSSEIAKQSKDPRRCTFGFATENKTTRVPIYYGCTDTRSFRNVYNFQNPAHEYFHLVHHHLAPVRVPLWLFEGSSSYFGEALGYDEFLNYETLKLNQGMNTGQEFDPDGKGFDPNRFKNWLRTLTPQESVRIFTILEGEPKNRSAYAHYSLGSWATEALVATYGIEKYMELWIALGASKSFQVAFSETFGLSPTSFYEKLTPYLKSRVTKP
ncbi:MAG: hypothetical protein RIS51_848 [Actinomycetota bacterium]